MTATTGAERQSDELTLWMLQQRESGEKPSDIARELNRPTQFVSTATNRILKHDLNFSCTKAPQDEHEPEENEADVLKHYW